MRSPTPVAPSERCNFFHLTFASPHASASYPRLLLRTLRMYHDENWRNPVLSLTLGSEATVGLGAHVRISTALSPIGTLASPPPDSDTHEKRYDYREYDPKYPRVRLTLVQTSDSKSCDEKYHRGYEGILPNILPPPHI
jgi:hypothetical protein